MDDGQGSSDLDFALGKLSFLPCFGKNMNSKTLTYTSEFSLLDLLGIYPALLAITALCLGMLALMLRRRIANIAIAHGLAGLAMLGFGNTAWRMHAMNSYFRPGGAADPAQWMISLGNAWMPTGVVLPLVGLSFMLLSLSWVFTKPSTRSN
jgi:hypothetical protein